MCLRRDDFGKGVFPSPAQPHRRKNNIPTRAESCQRGLSQAAFARDAPDQLLQRIGIFFAEIDGLEVIQEKRQPGIPFSFREDDGDERTLFLEESVEEFSLTIKSGNAATSGLPPSKGDSGA